MDGSKVQDWSATGVLLLDRTGRVLVSGAGLQLGPLFRARRSNGWAATSEIGIEAGKCAAAGWADPRNGRRGQMDVTTMPRGAVCLLRRPTAIVAIGRGAGSVKPRLCFTDCAGCLLAGTDEREYGWMDG